jgi:hypothetical protein
MCSIYNVRVCFVTRREWRSIGHDEDPAYETRIAYLVARWTRTNKALTFPVDVTREMGS